MGARLLQPGHQMRSASGGKWSVKGAREEPGSHAEGARGGRDGRHGVLARLDNTCSYTRLVQDRSELTVTLEAEVEQLFPLLLPRNQQEDSDKIPSSGSYLMTDSRTPCHSRSCILAGTVGSRTHATRREQIQVTFCCNEPERSDSAAL